MDPSFPGSGVYRFQEEPKNQLLAFSYQLTASSVLKLLPRFPANMKFQVASVTSSTSIKLRAES
jgi:hypothetical protein